ncbi:MAG: radical SAM protein, partial [Chitinivibrionales bacterium]|nr:radical SAM protein [Chitinivibrionales bacterium]
RVLQTPEAADTPARAARTRFNLKIQEGCDFSCAYCIVPRLRGPSRSLPAEAARAALARAVAAGFKEIVLTGTHIGQYRDGDNGVGIAALLEELLECPGDFRIRLSSLDARDISGRLLRLIGTHPKLCPHLHVSVQSLCGDVLRRMHRKLDVDRLTQDLSGFRLSYPRAGLGGDFIVGFPGESERQFERTLRAVDCIGFTYGHVFRFSPRPQTAAENFPGAVSGPEKDRRSRAVRRTLARSREAFLKGCIGTVERIVVERAHPAEGMAANYVRVRCPAELPHNHWCAMTITGYDPSLLFCIGQPAPNRKADLP